MSPSKRTIIIGDVHGCADELEELIERVAPQPSDRIVFIGDLINKGPDSPRCFQIFKELNATSILGNHEYALLQSASGAWKPRRIYKEMKNIFGSSFDQLIEELSTWPAYVVQPEFIAVHAGLVPDQSIHDTEVSDLVTIRTWDGKGDDLIHPNNPPWFELYTDQQLVVFGHWAALDGVVRDNVIGLDTGCVYGKRLTALLLPGRELVSVAAKEVYCPI